MTPTHRKIRVAVDATEVNMLLAVPGERPARLSSLPIDAKFVAQYRDDAADCFFAVFEHDSFPATPLGKAVPVHCDS